MYSIGNYHNNLLCFYNGLSMNNHKLFNQNHIFIAKKFIFIDEFSNLLFEKMGHKPVHS